MHYALKGKRVFLAGHRGMVGSAVCRRLEREDVELLTATRAELDLRDAGAVAAWMADRRPDVVVMAAAKVGGIHANNTYPVDFLQDNLMIQNAVIQGAHLADVERFLFLGSSCIYPKLAPQPIPEDALLTGPLEPTNEPYAIAKIAGIKLVEAYRRQYGRDWISAMPTNLYGKGDNYHPENSHVLPALLRRFHEAKLRGDKEVVVWGSGTPLREFMHSDDLADALVFVLQHYSNAQHINIGSGQEVSIRALAEIIRDVVGGEVALRFDTSKPDGTPRKLMDSARLEALGWSTQIGLRAGIARVYAEFKAAEDLAAR
jgi:GDP-L-fucose synthase